jgi:hypothetical protein
MATRYIDLSQHAIGVLRKRLEPFVEAAAIIVRDEIVGVINESTPAGRFYRVPGTGATYQASAPGQAPAEREGIYRESWKSTPAVSQGSRIIAGVFNDRTTESGEPLFPILEYGTTDGKLAPRPHVGPGIERALPKIRALARRASR